MGLILVPYIDISIQCFMYARIFYIRYIDIMALFACLLVSRRSKTNLVQHSQMTH